MVGEMVMGAPLWDLFIISTSCMVDWPVAGHAPGAVRKEGNCYCCIVFGDDHTREMVIASEWHKYTCSALSEKHAHLVRIQR